MLERVAHASASFKSMIYRENTKLETLEEHLPCMKTQIKLIVVAVPLKAIINSQPNLKMNKDKT